MIIFEKNMLKLNSGFCFYNCVCMCVYVCVYVYTYICESTCVFNRKFKKKIWPFGSISGTFYRYT